MPKRSSTKRSTDINQLAKSILDGATGDADLSTEETEQKKNPAAVALGKLGGKKGGPARAAKLSPKKRKAIPLKAPRGWWKKQDQ
jgi:hypothetical protein